LARIDIELKGKDSASAANKSVEKSLTELQKATLAVKAAQLENVQASIKAKELAEQVKVANFELAKTLKTDLNNAQLQNIQASIQAKAANQEQKQSITDAKIASMQYKDALAGYNQVQKEARQANKDYESALKAAYKAQNDQKKATDEAKAANSTLAKVLEGLDGTLTKFGDAAKGAAGKVGELGKNAASAATEGVGRLASLTAGAAVGMAKFGLVAGAAATAAGGGMLKLASDYESAFAEVKKSLDPTERTAENYKKLSDAAVEVGLKTKYNSQQAAEGLAELAQAGLNTKDSIAALLPVANAAMINNVDMAESAKTMTVAMNAFGISATDTTRIIDVQTKAANIGVMKFQDFGLGIAAGGAVAKMANQSFEDFAGSLVVLTNNGLSAQDAGTSMKSALMQLISPGKAAAEAIDALGLKIRDQHGNMLPFVDIVAQIEQNTKGMTQADKDFYLGNLGGSDGIRAYASALNARVEVEKNGQKVTLTGAEALRYYDDQLKNSAGASKDAAAIMQDTLGAKVENLKGSFEQFGITIGTALLPVAKEVVDKISVVVNKGLEWETCKP
jgi:TP901 family phage tail tape measure protein